MLNIYEVATDPGTQWGYNANKEVFYLFAKVDMLKSKEVFTYYGFKCNSRFLISYGFTFQKNKYNQACIFIDGQDILDRDEIFKHPYKQKLIENNVSIDDGYTKYDILIENNLETRVSLSGECRFQATADPTRTRPMFGFLRLLFTTAEEFTKLIPNFSICNSRTELFNSISMISLENELMVLETITRCCKSRLEEFRSSLEEDKKELENTPLYTTRANILNMLIGEKEVLLGAIINCSFSCRKLSRGNSNNTNITCENVSLIS
jgi:hypothetical protein